MSIFSKVKLSRPKRSTFNLSHETKWTGEMGWLMPTYWNYFEPHAEFRAKSAIMMRVAPMLAPLMHRVNVYNWWFAVPIRLLMEQQDFEDYFTGGKDGTADIAWPKLHFDGVFTTTKFDPLSMRLTDYLDFPTRYGEIPASSDDFTLDVMPFRAYAQIWNDNFRDENLTDPIEFDKFVGVRDAEAADIDLFQLKCRAWDKDYFTSALPFPQRGQDMNMPFSAVSSLSMDANTSLPSITRMHSLEDMDVYGQDTEIRTTIGLHHDQGSNSYNEGLLYTQMEDDPDNNRKPTQIDVTPHTRVNTAIQGTINQLREAFSIQRWRERMAIGGSRYIEQMRSMFGVVGDDARLQRVQYLGGSRVPIQISEVLQTSESTDSSLQGVPAGRGFAYDTQKFIKHYVKEHSIIMCVTAIVPKANYYQGMPRKCNIGDRYDFPWPILGHLGEQEVKNEEIFWNPSGLYKTDNEGTFGYQSRFAQYKFELNRVHGEFRHALDFWHMARKFSELPTLSREFIEIRPNRDDLNRPFAVPGDQDIYDTSTDHFWCQQAFEIKCKRPLPYFGTPH